MSVARSLLRADLLRIARDPVLVVLAFVPSALAFAAVPVAQWIGVRLQIPVDDGWILQATTVVLLLMSPMMFGFIYGLMLLDERDEGVLLAVALTPIGKDGFLARRMAVPAAWSMLACVVALVATGVPMSASSGVVLAVLCGLEAPLLAVFVGAFAANKVEGMALAKVGSVLIGLGGLGILLPGTWRWAAAVSPHFWLARTYLAAAASAPEQALVAIAALGTHCLSLWLLVRIFRRRVG